MSLIYTAVYLLNKDLYELRVMPKKLYCFPEKRMEGIFVDVLEYILTLFSLDKMQNISIRNLRAGHSENYSSETGLGPPVKYFNWPFQGGTSLVDHLCYFCIVFVMLPHLLIAALWSPAGKGLTSWLSFVVLNCVVLTFPFGILGQVWYLIVSIPDLCPLSYFHTVRIVLHISTVLVQ